jgi:methyl-galactoside transport system permease protein
MQIADLNIEVSNKEIDLSEETGIETKDQVKAKIEEVKKIARDKIKPLEAKLAEVKKKDDKVAEAKLHELWEEEAVFITKDGNYSVEEDPKFSAYNDQLFAFRQEGTNKIASLKEEITAIHKNMMVDAATKAKIIIKDKLAIKKAKEIEKHYRHLVTSLEEEAVAYLRIVRNINDRTLKNLEKPVVVTAKEKHAAEIKRLQEEHAKRLFELKAKQKADLEKETIRVKASHAVWQEKVANDRQAKKKTLPFPDVNAIRILKIGQKADIQSENNSYKSAVFDEKALYSGILSKAKDKKFNAYSSSFAAEKSIKNGNPSLNENTEYKLKNYLYKFSWRNFLLNNALYIAIIVFFIYCIIYSPIADKGQLLRLQPILDILENSSTRMFYALGVAGLILLAGTDLSIGRMVGLGAVLTAVLLHNGTNIVSFFGQPAWNFSSIPWVGRIVLALLVSVLFCTFFSMIAGFFSAKFKMHPFISTLGTSLIIYGLLYYATQGTSTGGVSAEIKNDIAGRWIFNMSDGTTLGVPKLIIPMLFIIIVTWFIWNKTKFGKNMFAVGGNREAAAVSGINVFAVTLGVFIMAGIYYGMGSFFESFRNNSSAGTGQGYELDAIAACVVGGVSFSGGIGTVKGATIGVFIFTALTYCLSWIGYDTNIQFIIKGVIIIAAVALDCAKYLKKK